LADAALARADLAELRSLAHLPLPLLAVPLGLGGLGLAWRQAGFAWVGEPLMALTGFAWVLILVLHAARALRHPEAALADWRNPVRCGFVGAASIGMMLTAAALLPHAPALARALLLPAVVLHLAIGLLLLARVLRGEGSPAMLVPPLMIPLVGNVLAPLFLVPLGLPMLGWMLFGVGMLLWLGLQPLLLGRLFEAALPPPMRPSLAILLAPSAVGALAVDALGGPAPAFLALYGLAAFTFALLLMVLRPMLRAGFSIGYWGFTFPLAAFTTATMKVAPGLVGWGMLGFATLAIGAIALATLRLAIQGALLRPH
jgi:tellurite resistance protein